MEKIEHILVVSRMSQYCREAVLVGISLAKKFGSDLQVLHRISNPATMEALNTPVPFPNGLHKTYASIQGGSKRGTGRNPQQRDQLRPSHQDHDQGWQSG